MKKERLKSLLLNAIITFARDEYDKETTLANLDMTDAEFEELTKKRKYRICGVLI